MSSPAWIITRRVLSLPILGLGALCLGTLSISWLEMAKSTVGDPMVIVIAGILAAIFLAAGFGLWGRRYLDVIAGLILTGVGCLAALTAVLNVRMLRGHLEPLLPSDPGDPTSRLMATGSAISAAVLLFVGVALLASPIIQLVRERGTRKNPVLVWVVLALQACECVKALAWVVLVLSNKMPVPPEMQQYVADRWPHGPLLYLLVAGLGLVGAVFLVKLRKVALWMFLVAFLLGSLGGSIVHGFEPPPGYPVILWVSRMTFSLGISIAIIGYTWRLLRRGLLN